MPAWHSVQSGAGLPPGLYEPALHGRHSDAVAAPVSGLRLPGGQGVGTTERAGQKQPWGQGTGGEDDAGAQKKRDGQGSQAPVPLTKKPGRQPETSTSTTLERLRMLLAPPPNRARFETDVATRLYRATLREAVVHNPDVTLKISTTL